jgi:hypothetical protein
LVRETHVSGAAEHQAGRRFGAGRRVVAFFQLEDRARAVAQILATLEAEARARPDALHHFHGRCTARGLAERRAAALITDAGIDDAIQRHAALGLRAHCDET